MNTPCGGINTQLRKKQFNPGSSPYMIPDPNQRHSGQPSQGAAPEAPSYTPQTPAQMPGQTPAGPYQAPASPYQTPSVPFPEPAPSPMQTPETPISTYPGTVPGEFQSGTPVQTPEETGQDNSTLLGNLDSVLYPYQSRAHNLFQSRVDISNLLPTRLVPVTPDPNAEQGDLSMIPDISPNQPAFAVPDNVLHPPGYQEVLDYDTIQYMNGFLRTQIGNMVEVEMLIGTGNLVTRQGFLIGVGVNYILLYKEVDKNVIVCDFYSIKTVRFINFPC